MKSVNIDTLIFDLDGTLIDSCEDIAFSLNYTLNALGFPSKSRKDVERFVGDGVKVLLTRATGNSDPDFLEKAVQIFKPHYRDHCTDKTTLYPGVLAALDSLQDKKLAIVSNKPYEMVLKALDYFSIRARFASVMGAESAPNRKPHPEPVLKTLEALGSNAASTIMVGDGTADIQAGQAAGVQTCAVTYGYRSESELQALHPNYIISKITDLIHIAK